MHRTLRWLDRCISAHQRPHDQNLFGIVQGRSICCGLSRYVMILQNYFYVSSVDTYSL